MRHNENFRKKILQRIKEKRIRLLERYKTSEDVALALKNGTLCQIEVRLMLNIPMSEPLPPELGDYPALISKEMVAEINSLRKA